MRDKVIASFLFTIALTMLTIGMYLDQSRQIMSLVKIISDVGVSGIP